MAALLESLLFDLKQRCAYLASTLGGISGLPQQVEEYRKRMLTLLKQVEGQIGALANDPTISLPAFGKNHYHRYKRLSEAVSAWEWGPVVALKRFMAEDALMSLMVDRMCQEVSYPYDPPLCVASGFNHYWTNPSVDLIVTPASEACHLLGLTDIYHELGHILFLRERKKLEKPIHLAVNSHFAKEITRAKQDGKGGGYIRKLQSLRKNWKQWLIEFVADMSATYLAGAAYGWANVRLCVNQSDSTFSSSASHPADDARTTGIEVMLEKVGLAQKAAEIRGYWTEFLSLSGNAKPPEFDVEFPRALLMDVRDCVFENLKQRGLKSVDEQAGSGSAVNVLRLLNDAWAMFGQTPGTYAAWEAKHIAVLKKEFGI